MTSQDDSVAAIRAWSMARGGRKPGTGPFANPEDIRVVGWFYDLSLGRRADLFPEWVNPFTKPSTARLRAAMERAAADAELAASRAALRAGDDPWRLNDAFDAAHRSAAFWDAFSEAVAVLDCPQRITADTRFAAAGRGRKKRAHRPRRRKSASEIGETSPVAAWLLRWLRRPEPVTGDTEG